jgi:circadian clock protein KaiC
MTGVELRTFAAGKKDKEIERKRLVLEAKIASLKEEFESVQDELNKTFIEEQLKKQIMEKNRQELTNNRNNRTSNNGKGSKN